MFWLTSQTKSGGADDSNPDENVEIVLEPKQQHKIISYDTEERISSVVVTPPLLLGETSSSASNASQPPPTTPKKKVLVMRSTKDIRNRNIEAVKRPTARRTHRVSASFTSCVDRSPRNTYHVGLQAEARSNRYDKLCRTTKAHRRDHSIVSTGRRGRTRERSS